MSDNGIVTYIDDGIDSRFTEIMDNMIEEDPVDTYVPQSRMELLLLELRDLISIIKNSHFEVVDELPTTDIKTNVIYLVPSGDPKLENVKDEYINLDGTASGWEKIGSTDIDLTNYVTDDDLATALSSYVLNSTLTTILSSYALSSDIPTALSQLTDDSTHRLVTDTEKTTWNGKADTSDIPIALSELTDDSAHRLVTDTEKTTWNGKADASDIPTELSQLTDDSAHRLVTDTEKSKWNSNVDITNCYETTDSNESSLQDDDYFPFYDDSDSTKKNTTWSNIKNKLISVFNSLYAAISHTHVKADITDFPNIPTVNNGTLTIQKNGTDVATFTANSSTNKTANITVPTVNNATLTIKQAGTSKGTFTANASSNVTIELTDNNTWRPVQNNLTSDSTSDCLSAYQGKVLNTAISGKLSKSGIYVKQFNKAVAISANNYTTISFTGLAIAGYTPILAFYKQSSGSNKLLPVRCSQPFGDGDCSFIVYNPTSNSYTSSENTTSIYCVYRTS